MVTKILIIAAISATIYITIALGLILSQRPQMLSGDGGLAFDRIIAAGVPAQGGESSSYTAPDGTVLPMTWVQAAGDETKPLVVMVHGSGWYGGQFDRLAFALRDVAEVKAVTLRGHGADPARRGDVDYIGQLEDDIAVLFAGEAGRRKVLLGHSSGGGLVTRFAGGPHGGLIDQAILIAPFLQYDAPTTRPKSGGWAQPLTRRIIGLSMLNMAGVHVLDHLPVIQFNMPRTVLEGPMGAYATTAYSHRLNTSFAPRRKWLGDVAALPPFLLIAGTQDEAMLAEAFEPTMSAVTDKGTYRIIEGAAHLDVVDHPETLAAIRDLLR